MSKKKYVVTGGAGFIGSHLVERLLLMGHEVVVVDDLSAGFESYVPDEADLLVVDIADWETLSKHFGSFMGADGVFHLAACSRIQPSFKDPSLTNDNNVTGTLNILEIMRMCDIPSIVYSASSSYYGVGADIPCKEDAPAGCTSPYSITKYMAELYCQTWGRIYGIRNASLRYFNVYGRRSPLTGAYAPVIGLFFRQALTGKTLTIVGDGEQKRDFTHVGDVVEANILAMNSLAGPDWGDITGEVFNIGTGKNYTINEIAKIVMESLPTETAGVEKVPYRAGETNETLADNTKATEFLGWEPFVELEDGIKDLAGYYGNNLEKILGGKRDL